MDGIHDLGGKHGFGPIDVDEPEIPFHHEWEKREWGISRTARLPGITLDWWRHCRELIMPEDYIGRPYYDSWVQTDLSTYIDAGLISMEEVIAAGKASPNQSISKKPPRVLTKQQAVAKDREKAFRFDAETNTSPVFTTGEQVLTCRDGHEGHTRLPQYARGRCGTIHAHHGAFIFPDLSSKGQKVYQHLYTVVFTGVELWPEEHAENNKIFLDLWESYLVARKFDR